MSSDRRLTALTQFTAHIRSLDAPATATATATATASVSVSASAEPATVSAEPRTSACKPTSGAGAGGGRASTGPTTTAGPTTSAVTTGRRPATDWPALVLTGLAALSLPVSERQVRPGVSAISVRELALTAVTIDTVLTVAVRPCVPRSLLPSSASASASTAKTLLKPGVCPPPPSSPASVLSTLWTVLSRLVPVLARDDCDGHVRRRYASVVTAATLFLTTHPDNAAKWSAAAGTTPSSSTVSAEPPSTHTHTHTHTTFSRFDSPATVVLKTMQSTDTDTTPAVASDDPVWTSSDPQWSPASPPTPESLHALTSSLRAMVHQLPLPGRLQLFLSLNTASAPTWFRVVCGQWLSSLVVLPGGVTALFDAVVLSSSDDRLRPAARHVAGLLANVSVDGMSNEQYYAAIGPQVFDALNALDGDAARKLRYCAAVTIGRLLSVDTTAVRARVLRPLASPLLEYLSPALAAIVLPVGSEVVREDAVVLCIERLHLVLTVETPSPQLVDALAHVSPALFDLYCFSLRSRSHLTAACEDLLLTFLLLSSHPVALFLEWCVPGLVSTSHSSVDPRWTLLSSRTHSSLGFAAGDTGGAKVVRVSPVSAASAVSDAMASLLSGQTPATPSASAAVALCKHERLAGGGSTLPGDVVVALLEWVTTWRLSGVVNGFNVDGRQGDVWDGGDSEITPVLVLQLLVHTCEELGPSVVDNPEQALKCVHSTLSSIVTALEEADTPSGVKMDTDDAHELLNLCLGLLKLALDGDTPLSRDGETLLFQFLPMLHFLKTFPAPDVQSLATVLRTSILHRPSEGGDGDADADSDSDSDRRVKEVMAEAMTFLRDPEVPVQAGGLQRITALVKERHPVLHGRVDELLDLMLSQLTNTDSYVYLAAVAGVSALADAFPDNAIPKLCAALHRSDLPTRSRVKVGMSISLAVRRCGDTLPSYARTLVGTLVKGMRPLSPAQRAALVAMSDDPRDVPALRAGCLSCLGDVCTTLGRAVLPYVGEIVDCCRGVLQWEKTDTAAVPVRRAAGFVLVRVVDIAARSNALSSMGRTLSDLKPVLDATAESDPDRVTRAHASDAIAGVMNGLRGALVEELHVKPVLHVGLPGRK